MGAGRKALSGGVCCAIAAFVVATTSAQADSLPHAKKPPHAKKDVAPRCADPSSSGGLHVVGNKIVSVGDAQFIPYGVSVFGGVGDGNDDKNWEPGVDSGIAQIEAAKDWHANTIRLQVSEDDVFNDVTAGDTFNASFLNAVCHEVQLARKEHMEVVINDQTEWPDWSEADPTTQTEAFWKYMVEAYDNEPGISFDLFNEPHVYFPTIDTSEPANTSWVWTTWRNGGESDGTRFIGMQTLVTYIQKLKANNVLWVEGPYFDDSLANVTEQPITGKNIVYSIHHPSLRPENWANNFGNLSSKYPVVDGEWSQYAALRPECQNGAYTKVPVYLSYLRAHDIGLLAWSLQPGSLVADPKHQLPSNTTARDDTTNPKDLLAPTTMQSNYTCTSAHVGEGDGRLILNYFKAYSVSAK
jgi:Cellulase (glycosyl hydrolase family 5)